jgi:ribonuclease BN (tRNA processing enzyme)
MRIDVLGGYGGATRDCRVTCLLINERVALDAGSLAQELALEQQQRVHSIVLTHSHMDHTNSLPFFIENVYGKGEGAIDIYASAATIYSIRKYLFNNATWPDFTRLPNHLLPAMRFHELEEEVSFEVEGVRFTPIHVSHLVPTHGFLLEQDGKAFLWSSDTGPTLRLWEIANRTPNLQALCIETSFENALQQVADLSLHLTPRTLERELRKLEKKVPILLHHLKPPSIPTLRAEVRALGNPDLEFLEQGKRYEF